MRWTFCSSRLAWQRPQREIDQAAAVVPAVEHLIPQRDPRCAARQRILDLRQVVEQVLRLRGIEREAAVAEPAAGWQHELRRRQPARRCDVRPRAGEGHGQLARRRRAIRS